MGALGTRSKAYHSASRSSPKDKCFTAVMFGIWSFFIPPRTPEHEGVIPCGRAAGLPDSPKCALMKGTDIPPTGTPVGVL